MSVQMMEGLGYASLRLAVDLPGISRYTVSMDDDDLIVVTEGASKRNLRGKRGLDLQTVDYLLSREQERNLALVYRIDQLQLFMDPSEATKQFNAKRKPGDHPVVKAFWEAHDNYMDAKQGGNQKEAVAWFKELREIQREAQKLRNEALERMFEWKKQAEAAGKGLDDLPPEELARLAGGA